MKNAKQFLKNDQSDMAVITLENILLDQNVDSKAKLAHQQIIQEAKRLGLKFLNQEMELRGNLYSI